MTTLIIGLFILVALLSIPIAHALVLASVCGLWIAGRVPVDLAIQQMITQTQSFPLIAIPFFMMTGALMVSGKLGQSLVNLLTMMIGRVHGGPAQVGVLSSTIFGGVSGSAVADASAIGSMLIPWLKKLGYPAPFAAGTLAAAATIDILIPPSIPMIVYALVSGASIGALFVAGILPGLLMCGGFMLVCYVQGRRRNFPRDTSPFVWREFAIQLRQAGPALAMPVLIIVFLRFGIATPTEVSVMSTLYALLVSGLVYSDLSWAKLKHAAVEAGVSTGVVLLIIMASSVIGWIVTYEQIPAEFTKFATETLKSPWLIILAMNLIMLATGMFIDLPAAVLLLTPMFVPLASAVGMDSIQLGIMMIVNLSIGLYHPPIGTTLFITSTIAKVRIGDVVVELIPFYLVAIGLLLGFAYLPWLTIY
ncbi:TRAP transporter large permease [Limnohabitans sp. 103DPR2]|jgi:tripartite ATP-independent transporter DctM subunit|uniref:TRAP transporter large permease n=1 Tax=Limnohabitans sp. 103DPR2 TaxID=1678129 RepID=UPI0006DCDC41|nr:TRAP transporter large permease [Limnohabitans sp. 103DPR2]ALK91348.1 Sialic acid TRAP transporter permease protein SiaT [Limnohabitans sp. 103DPR2]